MPAPLDLVSSNDPLPPRADVVVIGGGIIGASTAFFLARSGVSVVLCEKGRIGAEQSSRNWGWCRTQSRDIREVPLAIEGLRVWDGLDALIEGETGFRRCGILALWEDDREVAASEAWIDAARGFQIGARIVGPDDIDRLLPGSSRRWSGGLYTATDGRADPQRATPAIASAARRHGAVVAAGCAVRAIETAGGRIAGVVTEKGRVACATVVLAGGAWSSLMCDRLGVRLPQLKVRSCVVRTAPLPDGPQVAARGPGFGFTRRMDGSYTIGYGQSSETQITPDSFRYFFDFLPRLRADWKSVRLRLGRRFLEEWRLARPWSADQMSPFERVRELDPEPSPVEIGAAQANLAAAFPVFRNIEIVARWAGMMDVTPDALPVISSVDTIPGFFIATGFSGHGFGVGPGAGRLMAELASGRTPMVDPAPFRLDRFAA